MKVEEILFSAIVNQPQIQIFGWLSFLSISLRELQFPVRKHLKKQKTKNKLAYLPSSNWKENSNAVNVLSLLSNYQAHSFTVVSFSQECNPSVHIVTAGVVGVVHTWIHCPTHNSKRKEEEREEVYLSCGAEGRWAGSVRGRAGRRWAHKEGPLHHLGSVWVNAKMGTAGVYWALTRL